jgi:hypothetical protein
MKNKIILKPVVVNGAWCVQYLDGSDADIYVREDMIKLAFNNDQYISFDPDSEVRRRVEKTNVDPDITVLTPVKEDMPERELDPIVSFIHNEAVNIKPTQLVMPDLKSSCTSFISFLVSVEFKKWATLS